MRRLLLSAILALGCLIGATAAVKAQAPATASPRPLESGLSYRQAEAAFKWLAGQPDIAFKYKADGCYARAHLMVLRLQERGFHPGKVWSFPAKGELLRVSTPGFGRGYVEWTYHVAPTLPVEVTVNGKRKVMPLVFDPSMFHKPVTVTTWRKAQVMNKSRRVAFVSLTRPGEPPTLPTGAKAKGTGYWPNPDPQGGMTAHALASMKKFKALEPRTTRRIA